MPRSSAIARRFHFGLVDTPGEIDIFKTTVNASDKGFLGGFFSRLIESSLQQRTPFFSCIYPNIVLPTLHAVAYQDKPLNFRLKTIFADISPHFIFSFQTPPHPPYFPSCSLSPLFYCIPPSLSPHPSGGPHALGPDSFPPRPTSCRTNVCFHASPSDAACQLLITERHCFTQAFEPVGPFSPQWLMPSSPLKEKALVDSRQCNWGGGVWASWLSRPAGVWGAKSTAV